MWSHWWRHNDVIIVFSATENNFRFPGKLTSGDSKFLENFHQNKKAMSFAL